MSEAWMPGAGRVPAPADGGCLKGGAPRAVWLPVRANPVALSAQAAAERLIQLGRPTHLVWNPVSGDVAQLIPVVRAGRALGWPEIQPWLDGPGWLAGPGRAQPTDRCRIAPSSVAEPTAPAAPDGLASVNTEGRVCVQIAVLSHAWWPFTEGPAERLAEIVSWLDSWQVPRNWPAGRPARFLDAGPAVPGPRRAPPAVAGRGEAAGTGPGRRRDWAQGGHFAAVQVPGCAVAGAGHIDLDRLGRDQAPIRSDRPAGSPARIAARARQPRLIPVRSAAP